jgi:hypothetical protein
MAHHILQYCLDSIASRIFCILKVPPPKKKRIFNMHKEPTNFMQNTSPHHLFSYSKFLFNCTQISKWQALCRTWKPLGSTFHPAMTRILSRMFSGSELAVKLRNLRLTERLQGQHDTLYGLSTHRGQIRTTKNTAHTPCMTGDINQ